MKNLTGSVTLVDPDLLSVIEAVKSPEKVVKEKQ